MSVEAFAAPGTFYRGNPRKLDPEEVCKRYRERGYDFICLSDHFTNRYSYPIVDTTPYRTNSFTTILGAECYAMATEGGEHWHILAVGLPLDFEPNREGETGPQRWSHCHRTPGRQRHRLCASPLGPGSYRSPRWEFDVARR